MRRLERGQALVEFALTSTLLLIFVLAVIDLSWLFTTREQTFQTARNAARFAATNPTAWDNSSNPSSNSIEGQLRLTSINILNDDTHIVISYWIAGSSSSETECGYYSASQNQFVSTNGYSETTCLVVGTIVQIQGTYTYTYITPLLKGTFHSTSITSTASAMEEAPCSSGNGDGGGDSGGCSSGGGGGD